MKNFKKILCLNLIIVLTFLCLSGCKKAEALKCPFTEMTWQNSYEDIIEYEGSESSDTYDSMYYGKTYTYPKNYKGYDGTIKYMFDDEDELVCMAWAVVTDSMEELDAFYEQLVSENTEKYGKCGYEIDTATSQGNVWYLEDGNITLSAMTTESAKSIQFSFMSPKVAAQKP